MIFAAKTTVAALLALLVAFTFNLDQPQWALLTVFIVSQPQSGLVLAKSFYRIAGTLIGAAVALLLVSLFAQERVLFLGALALWIGLCTFGSQYARNFTAYAFVLSGYTVAIVGIPGALAPENAYYIATARVTEISLGIIITATISRIVLPSLLVTPLRQAIAESRATLADYALAVLADGRGESLAAKLLNQVMTIENLRSSAEFEDRQIRDRSNSLRLVNVALIGVVSAAQPLRMLRQSGERPPGLSGAVAAATVGIRGWRAGKMRATALRAAFAQPGAASFRQLREFLAALIFYAEAYDAYEAGKDLSAHPIRFDLADDFYAALWTGLRAALALVLVSTFWILADWPHGSTATILAAVATARLATMGHAVPVSTAAIFIFSFATIPAFVIVDVLMPLASGFEMFALLAAPMIFCCAFLMTSKKPELQLAGYLSGLLFASVGQFQDHMVYNPVELLNTSIAAVVAAGTALMLWSIIAPDTPKAARARFLRVVHRMLVAVPPRLAELESVMADALAQWRSHLRPNGPDDEVALEAGLAALGTGREMIKGAGLPEGHREGPVAEKLPAAAGAKGGRNHVA